MELFDKGSKGEKKSQLREEGLRRERDEDLRDDDQTIGSSLPDSKPDEMPEEHEANDNEIAHPERHEVEEEADPDKEFDHKRQKEVEAPEHERAATLNTLDSSFIGIDHHRKTGRMVGHEPGPENNL